MKTLMFVHVVIIAISMRMVLTSVQCPMTSVMALHLA